MSEGQREGEGERERGIAKQGTPEVGLTFYLKQGLCSPKAGLELTQSGSQAHPKQGLRS